MGKTKRTAENFMRTLDAYANNDRLSDAGFRELVRNALPTVIFQRGTGGPSDAFTDQASPGQLCSCDRAELLIRAVRRESLDLHRNRYMDVLDEFSMVSFSIAWLSDMPESRLRELLDAIKQAKTQDAGQGRGGRGHDRA